MALPQAVPNPAVMQAVEKLDYRVTIGDVATRAGLDVKLAQRELLNLAQSAGGHLQVAESGEIAYVYPRNFREVLRNKSFRLRLQEQWQRIWKILFYLIRVSFGVVLIASIVLVVLAITLILMSTRSSDDNNNDDRGGGGMVFMPHFFYFPDLFWFFSPNYYDERRYEQRQGSAEQPSMNFLEAVFSFLFGDGNPNARLEERRWQTIGSLIRQNQGVAVAEQVTPYLDDLGKGYRNEYEDYMLPVLTRFNGQPEVSPEGDLVYRFPELQATAFRSRRENQLSDYLREFRWPFSNATSGQLTAAIGLGAVNLVAIAILGGLLRGGASALGGVVGLVSFLYPVLLAYGIGFLVIPLVRYLWLKGRNAKVEARNALRQQQSLKLKQGGPDLARKLAYAQQFAAEEVVSEQDLAYTTEQDLLDQEAANTRKLDEEWLRRLNQGDR